MANVRWSDDALQSVEQIYDWIALDKPLAAAAFAQAVLATGDSLDAFPERGRPVGGGLRELTVRTPYVIRYRYDAATTTVTILTVWHGARDLS